MSKEVLHFTKTRQFAKTIRFLTYNFTHTFQQDFRQDVGPITIKMYN